MGFYRQGSGEGIGGWKITKRFGYTDLTGFLVKTGPGWSDVTGGWWRMGNTIRYWRQSDIENGRFWLTQLSRILAKIGWCKDGCTKVEAWLGKGFRVKFGQGENSSVSHCTVFAFKLPKTLSNHLSIYLSTIYKNALYMCVQIYLTFQKSFLYLDKVIMIQYGY